MHLDEVLALRGVQFAGAYLALTKRCPLSCAHCSTNSLVSSEQHPGKLFLEFVETMNDFPPVLLALTGGEPLLRPRLVAEIAEAARTRGIAVTLTTGSFFVRQREQVPRHIMRVLTQLDLVTLSLDAFHEREVPRSRILGVARQLLDCGVSVSLQVTVMNRNDAYLADVRRDVDALFGGDLPMLTSVVGPIGRGRQLLGVGSPNKPAAAVSVNPCWLTSWPVMAYDGTLVACCNQDVIDRSDRPLHLVLAPAGAADWDTVVSRQNETGVLRAVRTYGAPYVLARHLDRADELVGNASACGTCQRKLRSQDDEALEAVMATQSASRHEISINELLRQRPPLVRETASPTARPSSGA